MKKIIFAILALAVIAVSCDNSNTKTESKVVTEEVVIEELIEVDLIGFDDQVEELVGKRITIVGTVDHICEHGGQKMFIVSEDSDARLKIVPDEHIAAFNTELVGESIEIIGVVEEQRIDEDYLKEWEEEVKEGIAEEQGEGIHVDGEGEMEHDEEGNNTEAFEKINRLREMLAESGEDHLSFYSVLCVDYKIIEVTETEE